MSKFSFTVNANPDGILKYEDVAQQLKDAVKRYNDTNKKQVEHLIELSVSTRTLITLVKDQYRGYGKTYGLAKKAEELGAILLVPNEHMSKMVEDMGINIVTMTIGDMNVHKAYGLKPFKFLVDEVSDTVIRTLVQNKHEFLGGFTRI